MTGFISFAFSIAMIPWRAFVIFKMWCWFAVSAHPQLAVPKWNLYGIAMIVGMVTANYSTTKSEKIEWVNVALMSFLVPALILLSGWLIKIICL